MARMNRSEFSAHAALAASRGASAARKVETARKVQTLRALLARLPLLFAVAVSVIGGNHTMRRFLFVSADTLPVIAYAESKDAMRAYVRDLLGIPHGFPLPRHAVVSIA